MARALAADPPVLLMDEPFGALDPITREQLQNEFVDLESAIQKTVVLVTHDVFEAVRMERAKLSAPPPVNGYGRFGDTKNGHSGLSFQVGHSGTTIVD